MAVIFNTNASFVRTGTNGAKTGENALIGKFEAPIRMIIQNESDLMSRNDDVLRYLYLVMKSNRYAESFVNMKEFDPFEVVPEGGKAPTTDVKQISAKVITHLQFMNQFVVTANMMEDSLTNQAALAARNFVRSYYKTRNLLGTKAITELGSTLSFQKGTFDLTTADGLSLYNVSHKYGDASATQSNRFSTKLDANVYIDISVVENAVAAAAEKIRNMKDENGYSLGYTADTIMIPNNDPKLEALMRKVLGSEFSSNASGALSGAINTQYGAFTLIVNPFWQANSNSHPFIVMSKAANEAIAGGVFLDRIPLTVMDRIDHDTSDYVWTGRARMSVGFNSYKHIGYYEILDNNSGTLQDGGTAGTNSTAVKL